MDQSASDNIFDGSIPELYERLMVPLIFEPYAIDLSRRLQARQMSNLLEIAAGTGVLTRHLAAQLPQEIAITATDLNQAMLDQAVKIGSKRAVVWCQADVMQLPFPDASFDTIVCQFGAMFFPGKSKAFAEVRRVLKPGGLFLFNVWDRIEHNEFADSVINTLATIFPDDPPRFLARTPHGYYDPKIIRQDLSRAGFSAPSKIDTVAAISKADSARIAAMAYCQGTLLKNEIEARDPSMMPLAIERSATAIASRFGKRDVEGKIQALVLSVEK